jgi:hypothetical protein
MHADSPDEIVYQLSRQPVGASSDEIAALGTIVLLAPPSELDEVWTVGRLLRMTATRHGVRIEPMDR